MRVSLFVTCLADQLWPAAAVGAVRVLRRVGCDVQFDERQTCCGQPAFNTGYRPDACALARRLIEIFESSGADAIVSPSGSCTAMLHHYEQLLEDAGWRARARALAERTYELSSFLVNRLGVDDVGASFAGRLTWHDACHGLRDLKIREEPRRLLHHVRGAELVELPPASAETCCGFGGTFSVKYPEISVAILDEKVDAIERAGARVHWARDAAEACEIIARIAERRGARTIVKSKSMASEEIHLNAALARRGMEPVETDLGEYIVQLAGETPSHIVAPAIHKTRAQIGALFAEKLGTEPSDDIATLAAAARQALRRRFAEADLGVSGVNFAVAETGTILILENEGNARLTTSLPRTHVALMGIEKVIPRFADLEVFLRLLPRSGTGQALTAYQSLLTGTKRHAADEGPEELHIVVLDNGRSRMLASPVTRQTLACIRCGACLNACPVYRQIGGHAYGSVYPGPIGAVLTPQLLGMGESAELPYASSLCGACRDVCPVKIDIPAGQTSRQAPH